MDLSQYVVEALRRDEEFVLYRGTQSNHSGLPSILLLSPASMQPGLETLRKIEHEYSLRDELDSAWAVRSLALSERRGQMRLVLEDPGGETLNRFLPGPMEMTQFLRFAVGLGTALAGLHKRELIHKDVKPANVLVNPATGQARLIGFGIASRLPRERQASEPPEFIAGTLAYMAPEQTGRMNRTIDSRSDLYALGVTLYEMVTGTLPFTASDPMELVHAHIARQPTPPCERLQSVPRAVSAIIMKLLAKTAEERYQTAPGAASDLRHCLAEWESHHRIDEFPLGEQDTPGRLMIPEKLYGRESAINALLEAFDRIVAAGRPELVLVSGYSGIGKSSVVNELHKSLVLPRGLFASGKFDQYKRDIPYATLAQAFHSLLRPLLTKNEAELSKWRDALREAVGLNGQLIADLVPELKLIIGEPPPVPDLPLQDAQRRFQFVFRRFIGVFARPEHPLALFLDDLQWLDSATLDLIEDLLTQSDVRHLMLIGAYRVNEVNFSHPLMLKLDAIRKAGASVREIVLAPLTREDLAELITDSFHCEPERATALAELIHEKTAGNPFFAIQFVSALVEEGLLAFDHGQGQWAWDLKSIRAKGYTDNVVELLVGKLNRLPVETQRALQVLACLGNSAQTSTLSVVCETSEEEVHSDLWEARRVELIVRSNDSYKFVHDRVQEAAYSLIPEESRAAAHLRIGRLLNSHTPPEKREEAIFEIVNQFNRGTELISVDERDQLAELNLIAAKRAKTSTAYASALNYLIAGATLLPADAWESRHALTFALELNRAECEFLTGALDATEQRLNVLVTRAETTIERASVTGLRVDLYAMLDQYTRAIAVGLDYLRGLGVEWSPHPTNQDVHREYERIWSQLGSRTIEDLIELPLMTDAASLATMDVITRIAPPAFFTEPNLHDLAVCWAVNLSLERGNSDGSCDAYVRLGLTASHRFGDYRAAYRFGQLAYELVEQCGLKRFQARTYHHFAAHLIPCAKHVRAARDLLRRSFQIANESGDLLYASYVWTALNQNLLAAGDALGDVQLDFEHALEFARKVATRYSVDIVSSQLAYVRNLRGLTCQFGSFDDGQFDEHWMEGHFSENPNLTLPQWWYWILKLQAHFYAGDYTSALRAARRVERLPSVSRMLSTAADYHLFSALSHAASCDSGTSEQQEEHMAALAAHHSEFIAWAETCPANFENLAALVGAEIARLEGRELDAERLYEQAIRSAGEQDFIQNEALAYEVAARFYAARGFDKIANIYLQNARYGYLRWGAEGKVQQLDHQYPQLRQEKPVARSTSMIATPVEHLDLATVIKVSQAVSGEMVLEKLIDRLMRAAIEHAGAERGLLIVPRGDELQVEAEASIGEEDVTVHLRDGIPTPAALPESLVRYVMRTQETEMLEDASCPNPFSGDPYIVQRRARSILSLPLINQGKLIGILYLENNLTPQVFTRDRVTVLKVLASQAAISLENTRLYRDLEDREAIIREGERELRQILDLAPQFIAVYGPSRERFYANRIALDYLGMSLEEWRQRVVGADVHQDDVERLKAYWDRAASSGSAGELELRVRKADGCFRWFLARFNPVHDDMGQILRWYVACADIDDRKRDEERLQEENAALREEINQAPMFEDIVGSSQPLQRVLAQVSKVALSDSTVLVLGETGTGKELIARAIHKRSKRAARPFIGVNCGAIPASLIASELFGHEKGSFTGATQRRLGRFEAANTGTVFLDEVGDLPPDIQIALLRVLQEREIERIGNDKPIPVDVRVIAATHRDLEKLVDEGKFRQDLLYRLNVVPLQMPSLRDRAADIPLLVEYFIARFGKKVGKKFRSIDKKTLGLLQTYGWPGNIRELQNVIERAVILSDSNIFAVDEAWLKREPSEVPHPSAALNGVLLAHEKEAIEAALSQSHGRVSGPAGAAAKLGVRDSTLEAKIKRLGIDKYRFKSR